MRPNFINLREFKDKGILREANRQFFHPLGLALTFVESDLGLELQVLDYRNDADPEGIYFAPSELVTPETVAGVKYVNELRAKRLAARQEILDANKSGQQEVYAVCSNCTTGVVAISEFVKPTLCDSCFHVSLGLGGLRMGSTHDPEC